MIAAGTPTRSNTRAPSQSSFNYNEALEVQDGNMLSSGSESEMTSLAKTRANTTSLGRNRSFRGRMDNVMTDFAGKMVRWIDDADGDKGALLPVAR